MVDLHALGLIGTIEEDEDIDVAQESSASEDEVKGERPTSTVLKKNRIYQHTKSHFVHVKI